jgi:sulfite exporter TauE/SafE
MTTLVAGLVLGLFGSIHCAGMCGPILLAVNRFGAGGGQSVYTRMLVYHAARVFTYGVIGIAAGYTGLALTAAGLGRVVAIASGAVLVASAMGTMTRVRMNLLPGAWSAIVVRAGAAAARAVRTYPIAGHIVLGLANGLLPCGLLYAAVASSVVVGSIGGSAIFMLAFGLGTTPLLMSVASSTTLVPASLKRRTSLGGPVALALVGILLIARGILPLDGMEHRHSHHQILSLKP